MKISFLQGITRVVAYPKSKSYDCGFVTESVKRPGTWFRYDKVEKIRVWLTITLTVTEFLERYKETHFIEDDIIYHHPHCDIFLSSKEKITKYFKTVDELDVFMKELQEKLPHIIE